MKLTMKKLLAAAVIPAMLALAGCGGGGGASGSTPTTPSKTSSTPASVLLTASSRAVKSDGSDTTTITANVVDANNIGVSGATVRFTSVSGQLGTSSGTSNSSGQVTITYSAGMDPSNRTDSIVATVQNSSITASIPIKVTGSTLALSTTQVANSTNDLKISAVAKDVSNTIVENQDIRFSIDTTECGGSSSCGNGTLSASSAKTDANGVAKVTLTPTASGPVTIKAQWYNSAGTSTFTATSTASVTAVGTSFVVTTPTENNTAVSLGMTQAVNVTVPPTISGTAVVNVRFATTLGSWSNAAKSYTKPYSGSSMSETLTAGNAAGKANIQIDALDSKGVILASLNRVFALSAPASQAGTVTLQPSVSNVAPSSGGTTNTATLTATVRTAGSPANAVGSAPVLFEIVNSTGSGEEISPAIAYTNSSGQATTTFTSGSQSTVGGLQIKATVLVNDSLTTISDTKSIFVNATGVSVSLGRANTEKSTADDANYEMGMSVLVVDNAGTAVKNALVTLSIFPTRYFTGVRNDSCDPVDFPPANSRYVAGSSTNGFPNEDANENDTLDPGEDTGYYDLNGDGALDKDGLITPAHATAGAVPSTVTTDENGVASFKYIYQKTYADWLEVRVRAKVVIATGTTESTNELKFRLPHLLSDATPCTLPNSPANW